jgi:hypothetical protein
VIENIGVPTGIRTPVTTVKARSHFYVIDFIIFFKSAKNAKKHSVDNRSKWEAAIACRKDRVHPIRLAAIRYQARASSRHAGVIEAILEVLHQ